MTTSSGGSQDSGWGGTKAALRWNLRQLMAEKGMFATTDLVEPLRTRGIKISRQMVHRVVTKAPQRINTDLLAALCDILDCTPNDLLELRREHVAPAPAVGDIGGGIGDLHPIRARVRRPNQ